MDSNSMHPQQSLHVIACCNGLLLFLLIILDDRLQYLYCLMYNCILWDSVHNCCIADPALTQHRAVWVDPLIPMWPQRRLTNAAAQLGKFTEEMVMFQHVSTGGGSAKICLDAKDEPRKFRNAKLVGICWDDIIIILSWFFNAAQGFFMLCRYV